ncbi:hypothetical protein [Companilactobacillus mishanensis]|uniref:Tyr recombinase domain-containing protein n=1 Tax=Companilactobacillus mishanensis TaxID=2486008 RepID=A0A5P0ZJQ2_9LACO|nr:hypothetical protein [Companilactobacillus mishanensis]MQS53320.1 hypothetical protein [Companilactobacillus mishanensis]
MQIYKRSQMLNYRVWITDRSYNKLSLLISNGVDTDYTSERLGHKDMIITLCVYSHLLKKAMKVV